MKKSLETVDKMDDTFAKFMERHFTERERNLISNCVVYASNDPAGLPGHNLMIIIEKLLIIVEYGYNSLPKLDEDAKRRLGVFSENQAKRKEA